MPLLSKLNPLYQEIPINRAQTSTDCCILELSASDTLIKKRFRIRSPPFYLINCSAFCASAFSARASLELPLLTGVRCFSLLKNHSKLNSKQFSKIASYSFRGSDFFIIPSELTNSIDFSEDVQTHNQQLKSLRKFYCDNNYCRNIGPFSKQNNFVASALSFHNSLSSKYVQNLDSDNREIDIHDEGDFILNFSDCTSQDSEEEYDEYAADVVVVDDDDDDDESEDNEFQCQIENISWREIKVSASIKVFSDIDTVWNVITDYDHLAEFIPNLTRSERIKSPSENRVWVLQQGIQKTLYWHISAQVLLELREFRKPGDIRNLDFSMINGDFENYFGRWTLIPCDRGMHTMLRYEVNVTPHLLLPSIFLEKIIKSDMPKSLQAIADRAEGNIALSTSTASKNFNLMEFSSSFISKFVNDARTKFGANKQNGSLENNLDANNTWGEYVKSANEVHLRRMDDLLEKGGVHRRVISSISINASSEVVWDVLTDYEKLSEFVPNLAASRVISRYENKLKLFQEGFKCIMYMVFHAKVILQVQEKPKKEILFKQIEGDFESLRGKIVIESTSENSTLLKYVVETKMRSGYLLAEALVEKIVYEDLPANLSALRNRVEQISNEKRKQIKPLNHSSSNSDLSAIATVDSVIPDSSKIPLNLKNPKLKNSVSQESSVQIDATQASNVSSSSWQDETPTFLHSICKPEDETSSGVMPQGAAQKMKRKRRIKGLHSNFSVLENEIRRFIKMHGKKGIMPTRHELRGKKRVDLEKAIAKMGGFAEVAKRMGLRLSYSRKPKGYWEKFDNLRSEIRRFQEEFGMNQNNMPSRRTLEKAGRYDLSRALEKWGGLCEVAKLMGGLKIRRENKAGRYSPLDEEAQLDRRIINDNNMKISVNGRKVLTNNRLKDAKKIEPKPMKASLPVTMKKWHKIQSNVFNNNWEI